MSLPDGREGWLRTREWVQWRRTDSRYVGCPNRTDEALLKVSQNRPTWRRQKIPEVSDECIFPALCIRVVIEIDPIHVFTHVVYQIGDEPTTQIARDDGAFAVGDFGEVFAFFEEFFALHFPRHALFEVANGHLVVGVKQLSHVFGSPSDLRVFYHEVLPFFANSTIDIRAHEPRESIVVTDADVVGSSG